MKASSTHHRFRGWAHLFEWLLTLLLLIGSITAIVMFGLSVYYTFAQQIPEKLTKEITVEVDSKSHYIVDHDVQILPYELDHVEVILPLPLDNPGLYLAHFGTSLVGVLLGIAALYQLRHFVRSLRRDHPFIPANSHRLRCVAWLMLLRGIWEGVSQILVSMEVSDAFPALDLNVSLRGEPLPLFFIFMLFIIAEVFALGVKMKEDADLTV